MGHGPRDGLPFRHQLGLLPVIANLLGTSVAAVRLRQEIVGAGPAVSTSSGKHLLGE